ncbi:MAG TPA: Rho termination factor N-terminal domain-containing protein, partial [bacterium]|nr:Rho termination factor N-terminal domain-containing protein [bacterium]
MSENESSSVSINPLSLHDLKKMKIEGLTDLAKQYDVENPAGLKRQDLIFAIIKAHAEKNGQINADGVLEILPDGFGFIRSPNYSYLPGPDDIYVSPSQIKKFNLRTGDTITGNIRPPKEGERYFALLKVETTNFEDPEIAKDKILFDNLTPLFPDEKFNMAWMPKNGDMSTRIVDMLTPIGKGQRA